MSVTRRSAGKNSSQVVIQDIVIASVQNANSPPPDFATGEFGKPEAFGVNPVQNNENPQSVIDRLFKKITSMTAEAALEHQKNNFNNRHQFKPGKENNITRVCVNEFFFYTKKPLTIPQFEQLMQKVMSHAKTHPENLHLLLGSFAVVTPDNKVMNVVPQIECGANPKINLIVKNYPSTIDPIYREKNTYGGETVLPNIDVRRGDSVELHAITIDGHQTHFSFNNVIQCKSASGAEFHSCIDICLDHGFGVAKKRIDADLKEALDKAKNGESAPPITTQCSHVVLSNWINLYPIHCVGDITQADPHESPVSCKQGIVHSKVFHLQQKTFGTPARLIITPPVVCNLLLAHELLLVNYHNAIQQFISEYKGAPADLKNAIAAQFIDFEQALAISEFAEAEIQRHESHDIALQHAVTTGQYELVAYFLKNKADVNLQSDDGHSLLLYAASYSDTKMVDLLLKHGADPRIANNAGETPLDYAHLTNNAAIVTKLQDALTTKARPPLSRKARVKKLDSSILPSLLASRPPEAHLYDSTFAPPLPPLPATYKDTFTQTEANLPPLPPLPFSTLASSATTGAIQALKIVVDNLMTQILQLKRNDVFDIQNLIQELAALKLDLDTIPATLNRKLYFDIFKSYLANVEAEDKLNNAEKKVFKEVLEELMKQMLPPKPTSKPPEPPIDLNKNADTKVSASGRHLLKRTDKGGRLFSAPPKKAPDEKAKSQRQSLKKNNH